MSEVVQGVFAWFCFVEYSYVIEVFLSVDNRIDKR